MSSHRAFYSNTVWQFGLQIIRYILPLLVMPYLTRVLEPAGYAVYAYIVSFMGFAQTFIDFGFNLSGVHQIVEAGDLEGENRVVGAITQARILLCVLTGSALILIGMSVPIVRDNAIYAALSYVAVCARSMAPDFLFQGKEQMGPLTTRYFISKSAFVVFVYLFVKDSTDLLLVPIIDIVTSVIALIWSFSVCHQMFRVSVRWVGFRETIAELKSSAHYCLTNMASTALSGAITLVLGFAVKDAAQISYWSIAISIIGAVQSLYSPIINSLYPHMVVGKDRGFARRLLVLSIPFVGIGSVAFYLLIDWMVLLVGGEAYLNGSYVLRILAPVVPLSFYAMYFGWPILGALGHIRLLTKSTVFSSALGIALLLVVWGMSSGHIYLFAITRVLSEASLCAFRLGYCVRERCLARKEI